MGGIVTPEAVVLDLESAGVASRVFAALIDLVVVLTMLFVALFVVGLLSLSASPSSGVTVAAFLVFAAIFAYPILFETFRRGRTPGKSALGLRVVTVTGAPITLREATLRAMGGVVDRLLPPGGITGVLFVLGTPRQQRVGDLIAGTIVIRDPNRYTPPPALWFSPPRGWENFAAAIDPTPITVEQYTVLRSFLTRANTLAPDVRRSIADDLAARIVEVIDVPSDKKAASEPLLLCAISQYQRAQLAATTRR